jgi:hypothetical protein
MFVCVETAYQQNIFLYSLRFKLTGSTDKAESINMNMREYIGCHKYWKLALKIAIVMRTDQMGHVRHAILWARVNLFNRDRIVAVDILGVWCP